MVENDDDKHTVFNILKNFLFESIEIFSALFYISVYLRHESGAYSFIWCAAVFKVA